MVVIIPREIPVNPNEVIRTKGNKSYFYPKKIGALSITAEINPEEYALIQEGDEANTAISMAQQFGGLQFFPMIQEAQKKGLVLATLKRYLQHLVNVNTADRGEGVLYDALGNLIEGDNLIKYVRALNHNRWAYLNGRFPQGQGFRSLDFVTMGADGKETRAPLEICLEDACYAELGSMNKQGLLTRKDFVQIYKLGENVYFYPPILRTDKPKEGYVARFAAIPDNARVLCDWLPDFADASLGGIPCAEGAQKK